MSITGNGGFHDFWSDNGSRDDPARPAPGRTRRGAAASQAGQDRRHRDGALRQARLRGGQGRGDRGRRRRVEGRHLRLLRQQGRPVHGRVPERHAHVQQVSRRPGRRARPGFLRGGQLLARAHAAPDPRGLDPVPGRADRQLLLRPGPQARDQQVHAARRPVRDARVRPVRRRSRRGQARHRDRADRLAGRLADRPLPGRDRDRGARPRAVRLLHPVGADAPAAGAPVRRARPQRHRGAGSRQGECPVPDAQATGAAPETFATVIREARIPMPDGVMLAATLYLPPDADTAPVPVVLEYQPWCTGSVGMWGISWGGFNSIQIAMRQPPPPALKAIIACEASDDMFHDDVHYIDGLLHLDEYAVMIDQLNMLPPAPEYPLDEETLARRFDSEPWMATWLGQQQDGPYWLRNSLRADYSRLAVPAFLIAGWWDGYRDSVFRMARHAQVPVKALIGPWNHTWPHIAVP